VDTKCIKKEKDVKKKIEPITRINQRHAKDYIKDIGALLHDCRLP
jgi:hypothetical protein